MAASVLVVNAGSSSLKLRLLDAQDSTVASRDLSVDDNWEAGLAQLLDESSEPDLVGHRVVHGGGQFVEPTFIDEATETKLKQLEQLAPLHNPPAIKMICAARELRPRTPAVACFDTGFHRTLPPSAFKYALPADWTERWPSLRRFGFHGLSHAYASRRAAELLHRPVGELRLVSAHLGAGASLAAIEGGRSVDTTMGFTPLEGLVMATRSGDVDPGLLFWVQRHGDFDVDEMERALEQNAGLLGLSGTSSDMSELLEAAARGHDECQMAVDVYVHRLQAGIAAMAAAMGGIDALVFTGGVGEGASEIRGRTCSGLGFLGLDIASGPNCAPGPDDVDLSAEGAAVKTLVIHAREDLEIAAQTRRAVQSL